MRKRIIPYLIAFSLLAVVLIFFNKGYRALTNYSALANRHNAVHSYFQSLSSEINKAAVINPDLLRANASKKIALYYTDSSKILLQLTLLKETVRDSVNIRIAKELTMLVPAELGWLLSSNVPDSLIHNKASSHIAVLERINSLITRGIERTAFLIEYRKVQLNKQIRNVRLMIILFAIISGCLLSYTSIRLFKQHIKTEVKEKELTTVLNRISDGIVSVDNDWRYTFLNDAALVAHPLGKEKTLGQLIWDIHPQLDETVFGKKYREAMETKRVVVHDNYYPPMDTWFSVNVYPSDNGLTIFYKDITAQKRSEKQQALFASIVNSSDDAILSKGLDGIITSWNKGAEKIFGYTPDEMVGKHISLIIPPDLRYEEENIIGKIMRGQSVDHYETQRITKDGKLFYVSITVSPVRDGEGNIVGASKIVQDITKRKKEEVRLMRSLKETADYKFALDESSIVAITDHKGIINYVNDNFCKISKYNRKELIGQDHRIINSGYHSKDFIKNIWTTIANGKIWKGELKNKAKDSTIYWVDTTIVPFLNEEGKPYQYVAIRSDITERKKIEENLQKSLKEIADYKYALDESSIVAITDQKGTIKYANENFCRISKYSVDELIGQDHRIINSGYHSKECIRNLWVTIANGKIWKGELKNKAKDGTIYWVDTTIVPFLDDKGKPYQYIAIRADITVRKETEENLIKSEKVYKTISSSIPGSVICLLDRDYRYLLIEGDMLEQLGYSKDKLLGNKAEDVLEPEVFASAEPRFKNVLEGGSDTTEYNIAGYDIVSRYIPLKEDNNKVYAIMTVAIDVTKLKNAQRNIAELNKGLEKKIELRTSELKKINEEMEAFSYSVSHDLRAPLRSIIGYSTILEEEYAPKLDAKAKELSGIVRESALRMGQLIDDLLAFSKTGKQQLSKTTINTTELIKEVKKDIIQNKNYKNITWKIDVLPNVNADLNTIRQVWINLISNAVKYSGKVENPVIEIGFSQNNGLITFYVKDNGVGFDEEYKDKLFKVFQRLHDVDEFEGTGVGLALVEKIISKHGGNVWAEGKEDEGATFYFSLPVN